MSHRQVVLAEKTSGSVDVRTNLPRCWDEEDINKAFGKPASSNELFRSVGPAGKDGKEAEEWYNQSDIDRAIEFILCPPAGERRISFKITALWNTKK